MSRYETINLEVDLVRNDLRAFPQVRPYDIARSKHLYYSSLMRTDTDQDYTNPLVRLRQEDGHMTQAELAHRLSITEQSVRLMEHGLFQRIPDRITTLTNITNEQYQAWVTQQRHHNYNHFIPATQAFLYARDNNMLPKSMGARWVPYRKTVTSSERGFCRLALIQPSILRDFELHRSRNRYSISQALSECGVPNSVLAELGLLRISA